MNINVLCHQAATPNETISFSKSFVIAAIWLALRCGLGLGLGLGFIFKLNLSCD